MGGSKMCGIVGFTGTHQAAPILLNGLSNLEYRGYRRGLTLLQNSFNKEKYVNSLVQV